MPITDRETICRNIEKTDIGGTWIVSCAPGDMTMYKLTIQPVNNATSAWLSEPMGGYFVSMTEFGESRLRTMFVRQGEYITWRQVLRTFPDMAIGSAYVITLILSCVILTRCDSETDYIASVQE
jgi:hypothetical protein